MGGQGGPGCAHQGPAYACAPCASGAAAPGTRARAKAPFLSRLPATAPFRNQVRRAWPYRTAPAVRGSCIDGSQSGDAAAVSLRERGGHRPRSDLPPVQLPAPPASRHCLSVMSSLAALFATLSTSRRPCVLPRLPGEPAAGENFLGMRAFSPYGRSSASVVLPATR